MNRLSTTMRRLLGISVGTLLLATAVACGGATATPSVVPAGQTTTTAAQPTATPKAAAVPTQAPLATPTTAAKPTTGIAAPTPSVSSATKVDQKTAQALIDAITDEYKARATYQAVLNALGQINPFSNIIRAENSHIATLEPLFAKYGVPLPADLYAGKVTSPATRQEACKVGVDAEIANAAIYDELLKFVKEEDIRAAFIELRDASLNNHLPAFQRCD